MNIYVKNNTYSTNIVNIIMLLDRILSELPQIIMAICTVYLTYNWKDQKNKEDKRRYFIEIRKNFVKFEECFKQLRISYDNNDELLNYVNDKHEFLVRHFSKGMLDLSDCLSELANSISCYKAIFSEFSFLDIEKRSLLKFYQEILSSMDIINEKTMSRISNNHLLLKTFSNDVSGKYLDNIIEEIFRKCKI